MHNAYPVSYIKTCHTGYVCLECGTSHGNVFAKVIANESRDKTVSVFC